MIGMLKCSCNAKNLKSQILRQCTDVWTLVQLNFCTPWAEISTKSWSGQREDGAKSVPEISQPL